MSAQPHQVPGARICSDPAHGVAMEPGQGPDNAHWYLAQLKPGGFERATLNLKRQHYETFMPLRKVSERRRGLFRASIRPLFPGYLFVQIAPDRRDWRAINSTYGVARLVALEAGKPTEVPHNLMEALRAHSDTQGRMQPLEKFVPGGKVRIIDGPFAKQLAEIEAIAGHDRICLLMQMMGQTVRAQVGPQDLEAL